MMDIKQIKNHNVSSNIQSIKLPMISLSVHMHGLICTSGPVLMSQSLPHVNFYYAQAEIIIKLYIALQELQQMQTMPRG